MTTHTTMTQSERFADLLQEFDRSHPTSGTEAPTVGARVRGVLVSIEGEYGFVDLGGKSEGRIDLACLQDADGALKVSVGETLETQVTGKDEETGILLLGDQHGHKYHGLAEVEHAFRQRLPVQGQVTSAVKGGIEVQIAGLRAFCPASQVDLRFVEDLGELVGQRLDFRVTKLEGGRRPNLVVSRRAILEEEQQRRAAETRAQLREGAVFSGVVTRLKEFGAFVDIGGLEGMVHISELALGRVKHPSEVLAEGQTVEVSVLRIEPPGGSQGREKIALSIRALAPDPWQEVLTAFPVGQRVRGTVTRIQPFGVFIELRPGIEGLVHISELGAGRRVQHPSEVVQVGDPVEARVLSVDRERRRISLSLDESRDIDDLAAPQPATSSPSEAPGETLGSFGALLRETMEKTRPS
jgi:small subunit ribosomal protein S1